MKYTYSRTRATEERTDIDSESWKKYRLGYRNLKGEFIPPLLVEGREWHRRGSRCVVFVDQLVDSFLAYGPNSAQHQRNVEAYLQSPQPRTPANVA